MFVVLLLLPAYNVLLENLKGRDNLEDLGVDGKVIEEWMLGK
jgi:hypothetical protein